MDNQNYQAFIRRLIEKWKRRRNERRMSLDTTFFVFAILLFAFGLWLSSALLLLDKSFPANGQSQRIITPSPDGYGCNNLALNFWPFICEKRKRRLPSKLISKWFFILLLLCAGDVHPNPGPGPIERNELIITKKPSAKLGLIFGSSREVRCLYTDLTYR